MCLTAASDGDGLSPNDRIHLDIAMAKLHSSWDLPVSCGTQQHVMVSQIPFGSKRDQNSKVTSHHILPQTQSHAHACNQVMMHVM